VAARRVGLFVLTIAILILNGSTLLKERLCECVGRRVSRDLRKEKEEEGGGGV
jgi:hypothetical protein